LKLGAAAQKDSYQSMASAIRAKALLNSGFSRCHEMLRAAKGKTSCGAAVGASEAVP
jgi:hypothetical protein